jgi:type IV secretory pathway TraG/TraD family ATPase VirD4
MGWFSQWWAQADHHLGEPAPRREPRSQQPPRPARNAQSRPRPGGDGMRSEEQIRKLLGRGRGGEPPRIIDEEPVTELLPPYSEQLYSDRSPGSAAPAPAPPAPAPTPRPARNVPSERQAIARRSSPSEPQPLDGPRRPRPRDTRNAEVWRFIDNNCVDPLSVLINCRREREYARRITLGVAAGELRMTDPDTSVLVLGPPQGAVGKSAACIIPAILTHLGPCISVSTKSDVFVATSWTRRRQGEVWSISFDGSPKLPGTRELRWSPISDDWGACLHRSEWMVNASAMAGDDKNKFWTMRAADLLAVILFYAGLTDRSMRWVVKTIGQLDLEGVYLPMISDLKERGHDIASSVIEGIVYTGDKTRGDIFATAGVILRPYMMPGALAVTKDPNFSMTDFARGNPKGGSLLLTENHLTNDTMIDGFTMMPKRRNWERQDYYRGRYDTVYIVVSEESMELCAPLIQGFMADCQRAVYAQHREEELKGRRRGETVLWALDELASCPLPVHKILRDAGSQSLQLICGLQSLTQGERLGPEGKDLVTLFGSVIALPGIRDVATLEILSKLIGNFDQEVWGGAFGGEKGREWHASVTYRSQPRLTPDDIYHGNPNDPDGGLIVMRNTWGWLSMQAYYRTWPWPFIMARDIELFMTGDPDVLAQGLPMPQLMRNGQTEHLAVLDPNLPETLLSWQLVYDNYLADWRAIVEKDHEEALQENARRTATEGIVLGFPTRGTDPDDVS